MVSNADGDFHTTTHDDKRSLARTHARTHARTAASKRTGTHTFLLRLSKARTVLSSTPNFARDKKYGSMRHNPTRNFTGGCGAPPSAEGCGGVDEAVVGSRDEDADADPDVRGSWSSGGDALVRLTGLT